MTKSHIVGTLLLFIYYYLFISHISDNVADGYWFILWDSCVMMNDGYKSCDVENCSLSSQVISSLRNGYKLNYLLNWFQISMRQKSLQFVSSEFEWGCATSSYANFANFKYDWVRKQMKRGDFRECRCKATTIFNIWCSFCLNSAHFIKSQTQHKLRYHRSMHSPFSSPSPPENTSESWLNVEMLKKNMWNWEKYVWERERRRRKTSYHIPFEFYVFVCYQTFNGWMTFRAFEMSI